VAEPDLEGSQDARKPAEWLKALALGVTLVATLTAWTVGITHRGYDYDEVLRAHDVWLVGQGVRPYHDFFEVHPPYFRLLSPIFSLFSDPADALLALRATSLVGNLAWLVGLVVLAAPRGAARLWAGLVTLGFAGHPAILPFLTEFRVDGWGYALVAWGIARSRGSTGWARQVEFGVCSGIAILLICPKIALLPPLVMLARLGLIRGRTRERLRILLGSASGVALGTLLVLGWMGLNRIDPRAFADGIRFQAAYNQYAGSAFDHGLLGEVGTERMLAGLVGAGLITWLVTLAIRRIRPEPYQLGLLGWLVAQAVAIALPFKQYSAPWWLFASGFVVPLGMAIARLPRRLASVVFLIVASIASFSAIDQAMNGRREGGAAYERFVIQFMNGVTLPGDHVVAAPPHHPIDRFDVFFVFLSTLDRNGHDADTILDTFPHLRDRVSLERYRQELEAHPPALVVLGNVGERNPYSARQSQAIRAFVRERNYQAFTLMGIQMAIRPDRRGRLAGRGR
jgi:hypothetical protein